MTAKGATIPYGSMGDGGTVGSNHESNPFRQRPGASPAPINMPDQSNYIFLPWLCAVFILLWAILFHNLGFFMVMLPAVIFCVLLGGLAYTKYRHDMERREMHQKQTPYNDSWPQIYLLALMMLASVIAGVLTLITYLFFLSPYDHMGGGATYLNVLATQPGAAAADASAIMFADGTEVDTKRSYGFVDARNTGSTYCVAPVANKYSDLEPVVQFWAAGIDCCGAKGDSFGCGEGGSARGAMMIAREATADTGYRGAVEGAAAKHGLSPATGYLLLNMVQDPMATRQSLWSNALKLTLIFLVVYLLISIPIGMFAYSSAKGSPLL